MECREQNKHLTSDSHLAQVTAIIPCYRCSDTLERALDSILSQTLQVAEIILVDDASGDETLETLYRLQREKSNGRIKVIALSKNSGPGGARNAAWEAASQPWLAFLDADDAWHPKKIETQYTWTISQDNVTLCAHETAIFHPEGIVNPCFYPPPFQIAANKLLFKNVIPTRSVMLKRDLPYRFAGKQQAEDYLLWLEIILSGCSCWKMPIVLAFSFRPEFSPGGYSGALWTHEKRELRCFKQLRLRGLLGRPQYCLATIFSLVKFLRRYSIKWTTGIVKK